MTREGNRLGLQRLRAQIRASTFLWGVGLGLAIILVWQVGVHSGRAALVAQALLVVPLGIALFLRPVWGAAIMAFMVMAGLNRLVPGSFLGAAIATIGVTIYRKLKTGDWEWNVTPFVVWSGLLFTWHLLSYLWSPYQSFYELERFVFSAALLIVIPELVRTSLEFRIVVSAIGLGMVVSAASSAYGVYTLFSSSLAIETAGSVEELQTVRYWGHWEGPNYLGHAMMPMIVLMVPFLRLKSSLISRTAHFTLIAFGVIALMLSLSRAAILALAVALTVILFHSPHRWRILGTSMLLLVVAFVVLPIDLMGRLESFTANRRDASFNQRAQIYGRTADMIAQTFPFGLGAGGFFYRLDDFDHTITYKAGHAHNNYLQVLVEGGIIELLFYLGAFLSPLVAILAWRPQPVTGSDFLMNLRIGLIGMWLGLFVASLFEWTIAWPYHWLALVLMSIVPSVYSESKSAVV